MECHHLICSVVASVVRGVVGGVRVEFEYMLCGGKCENGIWVLNVWAA